MNTATIKMINIKAQHQRELHPQQQAQHGQPQAISRIEYTTTTVPPSMRSLYWNYFGFPSDNTNTILTRNKIVCLLCSTIIAYNRNTSNLRTHLLARHARVLHDLHREKRKQPRARFLGSGNHKALVTVQKQFKYEEESALDTGNVEVIVAQPGSYTDDRHADDGDVPVHNINTISYIIQENPEEHADGTVTTATTTASAVGDSGINMNLEEPRKGSNHMIETYMEVIEETEETAAAPATTIMATYSMATPKAASTPLPSPTVIYKLEDTKPMGNEIEHLISADEYDDTQYVSVDEETDSNKDYELIESMKNEQSSHTEGEDETEGEQHEGHEPLLLMDNEPEQALVRHHNTTSRSTSTSNDLILNVLIKDLLPLHTLRGSTLEHLLLTSTPQGINFDNLDYDICQQYALISARIQTAISELSQRLPYTLSLEAYNNIEGSSLLNIHFVYYSKDALHNVLYFNGLKPNGEDFTALLEELNLDRCIALMVTGGGDLMDLVKEFAGKNDLPIVECLESILTGSMEQLWANPLIQNVFQDLLHYVKGLDKTETMLIPDCYLECPWSKLHFMDAVLKQINCNNFAQGHDVRKFIEYLLPLKLALETVASERLPTASLMRPLVVQLIKKHFSTYKEDAATNPYIKLAQDILEKELLERIVNNEFLQEVTFFDPRFQNEFLSSNPAIEDFCGNKPQGQESGKPSVSLRLRIQGRILQRFHNFIQNKQQEYERQLLQQQVPMECNSTNNALVDGKQTKTSGLKTFFLSLSDEGLCTCAHSTSINSSSSFSRAVSNCCCWKSGIIYKEFANYRHEAALDLDASPIEWWLKKKQQQHKYPILAEISTNYLSIPCCASRLSLRPLIGQPRLLSRAQWLQKRFVLRHHSNSEQYLWYLHYNQDYYNIE